METNVSGRGIRVVRMDGIYGCRNSLEFPVASLLYKFFCFVVHDVLSWLL